MEKHSDRRRQDFSDMEEQLQRSFQPVQPNPEFVNRLRTRLVASPRVILEPRFPWAALLVIAVGLATGVYLVWLLQKIRVGSR